MYAILFWPILYLNVHAKGRTMLVKQQIDFLTTTARYSDHTNKPHLNTLVVTRPHR